MFRFAAAVVAPVVSAGLLAATLATTAARPLYHADLWAHLAYGRLITQAGEIPATEPLMPLAAGEPYVNFAWLAGVLGWWLYDLAGPEGLRLAGGTLVAVAVAGVGAAARRRAHAAWAGWVAGGAFLALAWLQLFAYPPWSAPLGPQTLRPQTLGVALFAGLLAATPVPRRPGWRWIVLPLGFLLWANLHGSWPIGLVWLAADWANRAWRFGFAAWRSERARRGAALIALCAAACCLNPLGPWAYWEALTFGGHPNLDAIIEWQPLSWRMNQGRAFFVAVALLATLAVRSPRRIGVGDALVLIAFGLAACQTSRWILWWAGPAAVFLGTHLAASAPLPRRKRPNRRPFPAGLVWLAGLVAGALLSEPTERLARGQRAGPGSLAHGTPYRATRFLNERAPVGQLFHAHAFGDYLLFAGPPDASIFVGSHAHLIPPRVWSDHRRIAAAAGDWQGALGEYGVNTLMLSPQSQPRLLAAVRRSPGWRAIYEDGTAAIFERVRPVPRTEAADSQAAGFHAAD